MIDSQRASSITSFLFNEGSTRKLWVFRGLLTGNRADLIKCLNSSIGGSDDDESRCCSIQARGARCLAGACRMCNLVADRIRHAAAGDGPGMVHRLIGFEQFHMQGRLPPGRNRKLHLRSWLRYGLSTLICFLIYLHYIPGTV
jgi:hypothetical protein